MSFEIRKDTNPKDAIGSRKPRWFSYLPLRALVGPGLAFLEGALKYGKFNWRIAGVRASVYVDATVNGHLMRFWEGEDIDKVSGNHHLGQAIASLLILYDGILEGNWVDDRPPAARNLGELMADAEKRALALFELYPNPVEPFTELRKQPAPVQILVSNPEEQNWVAAAATTAAVSAAPALEPRTIVDREETYRVAPTSNEWLSAALRQAGGVAAWMSIPRPEKGTLPVLGNRMRVQAYIAEALAELKAADPGYEVDRDKVFAALLNLHRAVLVAVWAFDFQDVWDVAFTELVNTTGRGIEPDLAGILASQS